MEGTISIVKNSSLPARKVVVSGTCASTCDYRTSFILHSSTSCVGSKVMCRIIAGEPGNEARILIVGPQSL